MRITRIRLADLKTHESLEIEPSAGLTIIRGPNESGKSTIQQAIELVLFRKADANHDDIREAWAWGSSSPPEVRLDFEAGGESGTLVKRFDGGSAEGRLTLGGRSTSDYTLIQDQVAEITGIPGEDFFRATASVGHAELAAVGGDEPILRDRLQKAVSGADRGTAHARKKLEVAVRRYRTEGHKNPGLLEVVREEMAMLESELADGEGALVRLQTDRARWAESHERREELDVKLTRQGADLAEAQRAEALAQGRDVAEERYDRLKRATELVGEGDRLQRGLPTAIPLPQLRRAVSRADSLRYEVSELEAGVSITAEADGVDEPEIKPPRPMRWLALAAFFVVLGGLASFFLSDAGPVGIVTMAVLAVAVIVALVQAFRGAGRRRQYGLAMRLAEAAASQRADADRAQQEQFRRKRRDLESTLSAIGVDDVEAAEALLVSVQEVTESLAQIEGELRGLGVEERNVRRLEEARDEAANETERANHALAVMGSLAEDPAAAREVAQRLVAQAIPARDMARSEEDQAQGRVDANQVDAELVAGLAERLAAARERSTEMERRTLVYQGTLRAIEAAERATLKTAARYLEERMGPTIATVTDGRYDDIEVDETSLAFKVRVPETGEFVDVDQLSRGTVDQLFLAARLGLVRLVTMDRRPPLILDDPFVTFDTARGERALRVVKQFAHEHGFQLLYLTCSDRFDALADELVVLPGPSNDRVLVNPVRKRPAPEPFERPQDAPAPTLTFEPDTRPNPDPLAPLRQAAEDASKAERDTGVADPFRLGDLGGSEVTD